MDDRSPHPLFDPAPSDAHDAEDAIEDLFAAYAEGFDDFDAAAIAACFAFPVTIWQAGRGNVFADEGELIENIEALLAVFEREEIVHSTHRTIEAAGDGESAFAVIDWRQERADGEAALAFRCRYALVRTDAPEDEDGERARPGWRIALAVND